MLVIDASVAFKWFVPEHLSDRADLILRSGVVMHVPSLIRLEVTGGIIRAYRSGRLSEAKARSGRDKLESIITTDVLELTRDEQLWEDAVKLSLEIKYAFADCLYLALAKREGATVVTTDEHLQKRGETSGIQTMMLGNYELSH